MGATQLFCVSCCYLAPPLTDLRKKYGLAGSTSCGELHKLISPNVCYVQGDGLNDRVLNISCCSRPVVQLLKVGLDSKCRPLIWSFKTLLVWEIRQAVRAVDKFGCPKLGIRAIQG